MYDDDPTVLLVDDETNITALFEAWLADRYDVRTANDGRTAIERMDEAVDVVLLDRRMPGLSGDEVLKAFRERGYDARVAMVTAVEPDFDVVSMGFDDYLTKPVEREELVEVIDGLLSRREYDEGIRTYYALAAKKAALEASKPTSELVGSEEYEELVAELERREEDLDEQLDASGDFEAAFQDV
ncbi:MAG: response regulator [Halanaeroarchaeum sp.]